MRRDNSSLDDVRPVSGGSEAASARSRNDITLDDLDQPARPLSWMPANVRKTFNMVVAAGSLGAASLVGLPGANPSVFWVRTGAPRIVSQAYSASSTAQARLARLKAAQFTASGRAARVERALLALRTLPASIQLSADDVKWIAEDADIEDV